MQAAQAAFSSWSKVRVADRRVVYSPPRR